MSNAEHEALFKKLQIPDEGKVIISQGPVDFVQSFCKIAPSIKTSLSKGPDYLLVFIADQEQANKHLPKAINSLTKEDSLFYVAYPKSTGKLKSDVNRDKGWDALTESNYFPVRAIALDENWSATRWRKKRGTEILGRKTKAQLAKDKANFKVNELLNIELKKHKKEAAFFESLSYSCKKEYSNYITDAKREETRLRRIEKVIGLLKKGEKTIR